MCFQWGFSVAWKSETAGMSVELMLLESEIHAGLLVCFLSAKPWWDFAFININFNRSLQDDLWKLNQHYTQAVNEGLLPTLQLDKLSCRAVAARHRGGQWSWVVASRGVCSSPHKLVPKTELSSALHLLCAYLEKGWASSWQMFVQWSGGVFTRNLMVVASLWSGVLEPGWNLYRRDRALRWYQPSWERLALK